MTIDALTVQQCTSGSFEVLLVTPFVEESKRLFLRSVKVVEVEKLYPPGRMRNIGARKARGNILAFIDDDCVPPPEWLQRLVECLQETPDISAVGCRVVSGSQTFMARCADFCLFSAYQYRQNRMVPLGSAALVLDRAVFDRTGGFDESLLASEDWDLSLRLLEQGGRCFFCADVEVLHYHGRGSFVSICKGAYLYGYRSGLTVQRRHRLSMSWLARCAVFMANVWWYWVLIIPYALALTLLQVYDSGRKEPLVILFVPMILVSRLCYQFGVWKRLLYDKAGT